MLKSSVPVQVLGGPLSAVDTEWIVLPAVDHDTSSRIAELDAGAGGEVGRAMETGEFKAKPFEVFVTPVTAPGWKARRVALVGLGKAADVDRERLRRAAAAVGQAAQSRNASSVAILPPGPGAGVLLDASAAAAAIVEGLLFAAFDPGVYKTSDHRPWRPSRFAVSMPGLDGSARGDVEHAAERAAIVAEAVNLARSLAVEPGNRLRPRAFAERAASLAAGCGAGVEVLDESRIAELGMGLLAGVSQGSHEPPRVLVLRHEPVDAPAGPFLALIGKGVTFDTGGISIKPAQGMERMKDDMAGGAAVIAALCAISQLRVPRRVLGVVPMAENMPGGDAIRPGDVLTSASGKTVEVLDTDAEGRLILADALWYARRLGATHLVDIATLTGACMVALGKVASGLFGRPQAWVDAVRTAAADAGDRMWPMPLFDEYRDQLRSEIADLVNVGGRPAGAITAAMFLADFAGDGPWAHLDVAGTAWAEDANAWLPKGPTGVGVRTLIRMGEGWNEPGEP